MNRKLLIAALAATLAVPAAAFADVRLTGAIQAEVNSFDKELVKPDDVGKDTHQKTDTGYASNNNYAISGDENLGDGLSVYFRVQNSFLTTESDSGDRVYARYLGIRGAGWDFRYGRMNVAHKVAGAGYDPFRGTSVEARSDNGGLSRLNNSFGNDVIQFGFRTGGVSALFQTTLTDDEFTALNKGNSRKTDAGSWGTAVKYGDKRAGWEAGLSYMDATYTATPDGTPDDNVDVDANALKVHGKWTGFGTTITLVHEDVEVSDSDSSATITGAGEGVASGRGPFDSGGEWTGRIALDRTAAAGYSTFLVGVKYDLGGGTELMGRYAVPEWTEYRGVPEATIEGSQWAIGVNHKMSKRTRAYAAYMSAEYEHNEAAENAVTTTEIVDGDTVSNNAGASLDRWAIGLIHKF